MSDSAKIAPQFQDNDNAIDAARHGLETYRQVDSKIREASHNNQGFLKTPVRANTVPTGPLTEIQTILSTRITAPKFLNRESKINPFPSAAEDYYTSIKTRTASIPQKYGKFYDAVVALDNKNKGPGAIPTEKEINDLDVLIARPFEQKSRLYNPPVPPSTPYAPFAFAPVATSTNNDLNAFQSAIRSLQSNSIMLKVGTFVGRDRAMFSSVLGTTWTATNWNDFIQAMDQLQRDLADLVRDAREKYALERSGRSDPLTPQGATFSVYVGLSSNSNSANLPIGINHDLLLTPDEANAVGEGGILTIGALQSNLIRALEEVCSAAKIVVKKWLDLPADKQNSTFKPQIQDLLSRLDLIIGEMQWATLPSSPPPPSLQLTIQLLTSLKRELLIDAQNREREPKDMASPDTAIQAESEGLPKAAGFLFRQISVERVSKYADTIQKFKDVVESLPLKERVATQKKRLEEACERFAKEVDNVNVKAADGIGASSTDVAILVKKLNDAKVAAVTSFARGVRGNVRNYLAVHETFVTRQHGEGMRYMQYWKDIHRNDPESDPKKKLVNDVAVVSLLDSHSKIRQELEDSVLESLVKSPTAVLQEAEKARVAAMTKQPILDEHHQMIVDKEFDRLREWIVAQTEHGQEMYIRGGATLLESITDSTVIGVYVLKAIRLVIAWVSLRVASRTFQAWYTRAVYEQNGAPPNPVFLVALFLGLDAALHAVVLTILYGIMSLYKSQENDFPIDSNLLSAWALDYAMVTVVVGVISVILAMVVRSKKYFRYRYEGERGIRALQEMCLSTYVVILFLPFYRLAYT